jgi:hypothetical protein
MTRGTIFRDMCSVQRGVFRFDRFYSEFLRLEVYSKIIRKNRDIIDSGLYLV